MSVAAGIFTVQLDFGASVFPGAARYLEISVKPTSGLTFTTLGPRQPLTSAPYTIRSLNAAAADGLSVACMNCVTSSQVQSVMGSQVSGAIPVASVPAGSANYIQNATSQQSNSNFNISGNGPLGGTLSANLMNATTQYNISGIRALAADGTNLNTFTGLFAGSNNTMGVHNSFFGYAAGFNNQTGGDNAFFGNQAGANSTGFSNSFFGGFAGGNNLTGSENAFFGRAAGQFNTTGNNNAFFGRSVGLHNMNGTGNAFFGRSAGELNISGNDNAFFGDLAGNGSNASGNSFFGSNAGLSNTLGAQNSFFGAQAGKSNLTGGFNAFFGSGAGFSNTGGNDSFFGYNAGFQNATGSTNSFFGYQAGFGNTMGNSNAFFGESAGGGTTTGSNNSFFGYFAGNANATGSSNTIVGFLADAGSNNLSNAAAIGARAQVTQSNSLVLGGIDGINNGASVNVGIGTTAPLARLDVRGDLFVGLTSTPGPTGGNSLYVANDFGDDAHNSFRIDAFNNDLAIIGNSSAGAIAGTTISFRTATAGAGETTHVKINSDGTIALNALGLAGSTALCLSASNQISTCSSSLRYKTAVQPFTGGLRILNRLCPISFTWTQSSIRDIGLAAEDVARVEPLLTFTNHKGEVEGVKYGQLSVLLINAIKEQQAQLERLHRELEQRRREFEILKKLMCENHPAARVCSAGGAEPGGAEMRDGREACNADAFPAVTHSLKIRRSLKTRMAGRHRRRHPEIKVSLPAQSND